MRHYTPVTSPNHFLDTTSNVKQMFVEKTFCGKKFVTENYEKKMNKYESSDPIITDEQWTEHYDESVCAYYYYNNITGVSQWEKPEDFRENIEIKKKPLIKKNKRNSSRILPVDDSEKMLNCGVINPEDESDQPKQDYLGLAKIYKIQKPYRNYNSDIKCILCHKNKPTMVLYPCQHRCICDQCLQSEVICSVEDMTNNLNGFCNCPLCGTVIKKILPADNGNDEEIYWNWVMEVKPPLPDDFMKNFRHSAAVIQKVYIDENIRSKQQKNCCIIS